MRRASRPRRGTRAGPAAPAPGAPTGNPGWLAARLGAEAHGLPGRHLEVLKARYGIGGAIRSLEELAAAYGVTRERIRQIEEDAFARIDVPGGVLGEIRAKFRTLATEAPLVFEDVLAEPWAEGVGRDGLRKLLGRLGPPHAWYATIQNMPGMTWSALVPIPREDWDAARGAVLSAIRDADPYAPMEDMVGAAWDAMGELAAEHREAVLASYGGFGLTDGVITHQMRLLGAEGATRALIAHADRPIPMAELMEVIDRASGGQVPLHVIRHVIEGEGMTMSEAGVVGIRARLAGADRDRIVIACVAVMDAAAARRWGTEELLEAIAAQGIGEGLDAAGLDALLKHDSRLTTHGKATWSARSTRRDRAGVDGTLAEAVEGILADHGAPMGVDALAGAVRARRGLLRFATFTEAGRSIRVAPGVWGLVDRDLPVPVRALEAYAARVRAMAHDEPLTMDEVAVRAGRSGVEGVNDDALRSVLRLFAQARFDHGGRLRPWGEAPPVRPDTIRGHAIAVMAATRVPVTLDHVARGVARRMGRMPSHPTIRQALNDCAEADTSQWPYLWSLKPGYGSPPVNLREKPARRGLAAGTAASDDAATGKPPRRSRGNQT